MNTDKFKHWEFFAAGRQSELTAEEMADLHTYQREKPDDWRFSGRIKNGLDELKGISKPDEARSWKTIRSGIRAGQIRRMTVTTLKYAAVVVVSLFVGYFIHNQSAPNSGNQYAEIEVMYGQMGHLYLFDGTEVWLNSGSRLKYPGAFNQEERDVYLEGEAYFNVKPNKHLPFKVKTKKIEVEVLGTSFNVSAYGDDADVSVVLEQGKVRLNQPGGREIARMVPGELAKLNSDLNKLTLTDVDTKYYTNWKDGTLEFKCETLSEIAQKLERWYNVKINIQDPELVNYQITGTVLRNKPVQQIIQAFEFLAPIRTEYLSKSTSKDIINIYKK